MFSKVVIGGAGADSDATTATVSCEENELVFRVIDPTTGKELLRRIDAGRVENVGRARMVALVIVELIAAS